MSGLEIAGSERKPLTYSSRVLIGHTLDCESIVIMVEGENVQRVSAQLDLHQAGILARDLGRLVKNLKRRPKRTGMEG